MKKVKIIATLASLVMAIAMLAFATFATFAPVVNIGGGTIVATGELSYTLDATSDGSKVLKLTQGGTVATAAIDSKDLANYEFDSLTTATLDGSVTIVFTFENTGAYDLEFVFGFVSSDLACEINGNDVTEYSFTIAASGTEAVSVEIWLDIAAMDPAQQYVDNNTIGQDLTINGTFGVTISTDINGGSAIRP